MLFCIMNNTTTVLDNNIEVNTLKDLSLYLDLGHSAAEKGEVDEAKNWYSIGLQIAKKENNLEIEKEFNRFLFTLL